MPSPAQPSPRALAASVAYFALVFGTGFLLGSIRVPFLVPRLGARIAELLEMPVMLVVAYLSARFIVRRYALAGAVRAQLAAGGIALALVLVTEISFAFVLQGQSPGDYISSRDPVSGGAFLAVLGVFALMPYLVDPGRK